MRTAPCVMCRCLAHAALFLFVAALLSGCGRDRPAKSAESQPHRHVCEYGMVIFFGLGGDSERLRAGQPGWSATEQLFTWTEGTRASLALRLPASKRPIRLAFKMAGLVDPERLPFQPVNVSVNGEKLATWEVADLRIYTLSVPKRFVAHPASFLRIDFDIPRATPPAALGQSNDERALGLCVRELRIVKPPRGAQPPPQP